ncbi:MAG: MupA/Atu3671 family FMN-dependent luciferase-like monooxygenase [Acidobacteriota bacterium]|nr:MupA/Atu3671 family FMN-dependent luciferase-like monooxygenase [Acidobacteriota bacterium]
MSSVDGIGDVLHQRAQEQPDRVAFRFLADGESESESLTYAELDHRARTLAARLSAEVPPGERALLQYPPGLDFVVAFFACLLSGVVAVPAYPPRNRRRVGTLRAVAADAQCRLVLTDAALLARSRSWGVPPELASARWLATEELAVEDPGGAVSLPAIAGEDLAFLQYTSGSTATPKGVRVTHRNLLHNQEMIHRAFAMSEDSVVVSWLPLYHDMGLIGTVLQPLYAGATCVLLPPVAFLQRPRRWLEAIHCYRATTSGGPDFAYQLCVDKVSAEERSDLDLSSWRVAFNGAEPVRAATLERFTEAFGGCGFRRQAFYPCYGLAEATLFVAGGAVGKAPEVESYSARALEQAGETLGTRGQARAAEEGEATARLVPCGGPWSEQELRIVDPETRRPLPLGSVGEIWLAGESVADGYWRRPELSREIFDAELEGADEPSSLSFLRTGDLGFLDPNSSSEAQLFVTGRLKDLIILRGRNLYPQDVERIAEAAHGDLRPGGGAAFSVEVVGSMGGGSMEDGLMEEGLVLVHEVVRHPRDPLPEVMDAARRAVAQELEARVREVVLIATGSLLKTSSGKVRRRAMRQAYLQGELKIIARSGDEREPEAQPEVPAERGEGGAVASIGGAPETAELGRKELLALPAEERSGAVVELLRSLLARSLGPAAHSLSEHRPLTDLGLDSLAAVELQQRVEQRLGAHLDLADLLEGASLERLARSIQAVLESGEGASVWTLEDAPAQRPDTFPLSIGQRALWFLERLAPEAAVYNIAAAARVRGRLNGDAFGRALEALTDAHEVLRTTFAPGSGDPVQRVLPRLVPEVRRLEVGEGSPEALLELLEAEAFRPFDLETGPLVRATVIEGEGVIEGRDSTSASEESFLVLAVHHLISDFRSLALMLRQLETLYRRAQSGDALEASSPEAAYFDFVAAQQNYLASEAAARDRAYWHRRLSLDSAEAASSLPVLPPPLELPTDRPRPPVQGYRGRSHAVRWQGAWVEQLERLAEERQTTVSTVLLTLFQLWLARLSGQRDVLTGMPTLGRPTRAFAEVLGYFVNPVVVRANIRRGTTFGQLLERQREAVHQDLAHRHYPFPQLAEELQPTRDASRSPVFQVLFSYQQAAPGEPAELAGFAVGEGGQKMSWADLELESVALPGRPVPFDLSFTVAPARDGGEAAVVGSLQLNGDLFDAATGERLARQLGVLTRAALAEPGMAASRLPLLTAAERQQLVERWNDTAGEVPEPLLVHEMFRRQARCTPQRPALLFADQELTYGQVDERSDQLAALLRQRGVKVEDKVALCAERSAGLVVALLAILKTGAAYLPLDPTYPEERLRYMLQDSGARLLLTEPRHAPRFRSPGLEILELPEGLDLGEPSASPAAADEEARGTEPGGGERGADPASRLAYIIYTSGSTGLPKGTLVPHGTVANFFAAMDRHLEPAESTGGEPGTWLAVTSISFDISVLELLWTLTRGYRVVVQPTAGQSLEARLATRRSDRGMDFGLFFFSADSTEGEPGERYRLLLDAARFADRRGFSSVWTPERHFHAFGGLYPNPSVTGAALAAITERVGIRAGSVVLPLHHPVRVAEEWSVVDNLSGGRVGLSVASGWHPDDFIFQPEAFENRKQVLEEKLEQLRQLWRGEALTWTNGAGEEATVRILPAPLQPEIPIWVTAAGSPETFRAAGRLGARVLTHLLGQSYEQLEEKLAIYRQAWREAGHPPLELEDGRSSDGYVSLMLHTYVGQRAEAVRETVREPFKAYLKTSFGLMRSLAPGQDLEAMTEEDMARLLDRAFDRYFETSGLFGTPAQCLDMVDRLKDLGIDEIGCLVDFGVDRDGVMASLELLDLVRRRSLPAAAEQASATAVPASLPESLRRYGVSHLQCTPSQARALLLDPDGPEALAGLRQLLVGGEALPVPLARDLAAALAGDPGSAEDELRASALTEGALINVYGPTETTIWSSAHRLSAADLGAEASSMAIGGPLLNTEILLLDRELQPVPQGQPGELYIGGLGVVRGYHGQPGRTAERFVPDVTARRPGGRLYRTGDLARYRPGGVLEFLGRNDQQIKLRGHRVELGEIEARLAEHPGVRAAAVVVRQLAEGELAGDERLVAYIVPARERRLTPPPEERRRRLLADREHFELPGGLPVAQIGSANTQGLVQEIFTDQIYLRHGVTLEDGACVFDIGANIGLFTLFVHQRCRDPKVFCFEPIPPTCEVLRTNVELYGLGAQVFQCGVGEARQQAEFTFYPQMAGLSGRFPEEDAETTRSILETWFGQLPESELTGGKPEGEALDALVDEYLRSETFSCQIETVSEMIRRTGVEAIDLLKIDVERSEVQVLEGIEDEHWPLIRQTVLEIHSKELLEQVSDDLAARGFELQSEELIPVDGGDNVYMLYGVRPEFRRSSPAASVGPAEPAAEELGEEISADALRAYLAQRLPEIMVPARFVTLDALPLTPNGKIDRRALPAPEEAGGPRRREMVAPTNDLERTIAEVWQEALKLPAVGIHDNFFETGGNSLLLVTAQTRLREALGQEVTLVDLMRYPTVHSLAAHLARGAGGAEAQREVTRRKVAQRGQEQRKALERQRAAQRRAQRQRRGRPGPTGPRRKP